MIDDDREYEILGRFEGPMFSQMSDDEIIAGMKGIGWWDKMSEMDKVALLGRGRFILDTPFGREFVKYLAAKGSDDAKKTLKDITLREVERN